MKKTINRLLLAMAVCAGSAYSRGSEEKWENDRNMIYFMDDTISVLSPIGLTLENAIAAIDAVDARNDAVNKMGPLLESLNVNVSSVYQSTNPVQAVHEMIKIAQAKIKDIDTLLNKDQQPSNKDNRQAVSNQPSTTGGGSREY